MPLIRKGKADRGKKKRGPTVYPSRPGWNVIARQGRKSCKRAESTWSKCVLACVYVYAQPTTARGVFPYFVPGFASFETERGRLRVRAVTTVLLLFVAPSLSWGPAFTTPCARMRRRVTARKGHTYFAVNLVCAVVKWRSAF